MYVTYYTQLKATEIFQKVRILLKTNQASLKGTGFPILLCKELLNVTGSTGKKPSITI